MTAHTEDGVLPDGQAGPEPPKRTGAGVGGVGAGTGLVAIAQVIGPSTVVGSILLYLAPALAFVAGAIFFYLQTQISRYFERRVFRIAMKTLESQLDNPRTSTTHKAKIRKMLEEMEIAVASAELGRVKLAGAPPTYGDVGLPPSASGND
jgi:hypothetical protein